MPVRERGPDPKGPGTALPSGATHAHGLHMCLYNLDIRLCIPTNTSRHRHKQPFKFSFYFSVNVAVRVRIVHVTSQVRRNVAKVVLRDGPNNNWGQLFGSVGIKIRVVPKYAFFSFFSPVS